MTEFEDEYDPQAEMQAFIEALDINHEAQNILIRASEFPGINQRLRELRVMPDEKGPEFQTSLEGLLADARLALDEGNPKADQ